MRRNLMVMFLVLLYSLPIFSNEVGTISGKVYDSETGEPLPKATIVILDTKLGGYSDVKGEFRIKNVPAGSYKLQARYVGYLSKNVADVKVEPNKSATISIVLEQEIKQGKEIIIEATRINDNESAILLQRKNADQVSDGISIQEIKRLPDGDAGQSLKRVSGVTLMSDKFVYIRGTSERYNNTILNGSTLSSTEPDKKAFAFDMFPSDFLENASVVKSFTPDLPGNFVGGLVELNTVDFPTSNGFSINFSTGLNDQISLKSNKFTSFNGGNADWIGFDKSFYDYPKQVPSSPDEMKKFLYTDMRASDETAKQQSIDKWKEMGKGFNSSTWSPDRRTALPNLNGSFSYSRIFNVFDNDFGVAASMNYNNGYSYDSFSRALLLSNGVDKEYEGNGIENVFTTTLGGLLNLAYKINDANTISFKNIFNNTSDYNVTQLMGRRQETQLIQMSMDYIQKTMYTGQLEGTHLLNFNNSVLEWKAGYSKSLRAEPDLRRVRYSRNDSTLPYRLDIYNLPQGSGTQAGRFFSNLDEDAFSGGFDYKISFGNVAFKLGTYLENKRRDFNVRSFTIVEAPAILKTYYDPELGYEVKNYVDPSITSQYYINDIAELNPSILFNPNNFYEHGFGLSEDTRNIDSYRAKEDLYAGYLMTDFPLQVFGRKLRIIAGLRFEHSLQNLSSFYPFFNESNSTYFDSTYVNKTYNDFLPSFNLVYELTKSTNLRASATQTLTRPSLREYAPFTFYDFAYQSDVVGNTNLIRALIQNYDLRWEWFPAPGEVFSVSAFYKIFDHAIEETIQPTSSETQRTFTNALGKAYNYGLEFEARKNLGFIADLFNYFSINFNLALIKSEITVKQTDFKDTRSMWGQSPYSLNLGLFYFNPNWGTSFNLAYNTFGKRIIQVANIHAYAMSDPHIYELPRNMIDFSISQKFLKNFQVKLSARNILNAKTIWKQGETEVAKDIMGVNYSLGIDLKF
ncbi:MAG TPA: hypothetical protein DCW42_02530 [Bacteroidetes bacterium]|nr:hypothetical protein [Bacteroidota bacterium]